MNEQASFSRQDTNIVPLFPPPTPPSTKSVTLSQQASHGTVDLSTDGSFTYTPQPDAATGEPYIGWDFFSYTVSEQNLPTREAWVQLFVGLDYAPPPQIVTQAESYWVPRPFDGTLDALEAEYNQVKGLAATVLSGWNALGTRVQEVYDAREDTDEAVLSTVDGAINQLTELESDYLTYLDGFNDLNSHAGSYQPSWRAYRDNLTDGDRYWRVLSGIQGLPRDIGGLKPNKEYNEKLSQALSDFGAGAAIAVDNAGTVVTTAKTTHDVLEAVQLSVGVGALFYTGARLALKEGLTACARHTATALIYTGAASAVSLAAEGLAQQLGVPADYIRIGADSLQVVMLWRAARVAAIAARIPKAAELNLTKTVAKQLNATDPRTGNLLRPFTQWRLVMQEIMNGGIPRPDPGGVPGAYRWDVAGKATVNGVVRSGRYELVVDCVSKLVLHFNFIPA